MDRASQVLAQGVPPGVPKSYRALADHWACLRKLIFATVMYMLPNYQRQSQIIAQSRMNVE